jgi:hypothetical protein
MAYEGRERDEMPIGTGHIEHPRFHTNLPSDRGQAALAVVAACAARVRGLKPAHFTQLRVPTRNSGGTIAISRLDAAYQTLFSLTRDEIATALSTVSEKHGATVREIVGNTVIDLHEDQRLVYIAEIATPTGTAAARMHLQLFGCINPDPYEALFPVTKAAITELTSAIQHNLLSGAV